MGRGRRPTQHHPRPPFPNPFPAYHHHQDRSFPPVPFLPAPPPISQRFHYNVNPELAPPPPPLPFNASHVGPPTGVYPPIAPDMIPGSPGFMVRPHPHLPSSTLHISSIPPNVEEITFAEALSECMPIKVKMEVVVPEEHRLKPHVYYEWMRKTGTIQFHNSYALEKALATLPTHPSILANGINVSPYPPPLLLPTPPIPCPARYICPIALAIIPPTGEPPSDPQSAFLHSCPTPGDVFDCARPWGAIRVVSIWLEDCHGVPGQPDHNLTWKARVEFWQEDEARRFELSFGANGYLLKGWRVSIFSEINLNKLPPSGVHEQPFPPSSAPPPIHAPLGGPGGIVPGIPLLPPPSHTSSFASYPPGPAAAYPFAPIPGGATEPPMTPPITPFTPPWQQHHILAGAATSSPPSPASMYTRRTSLAHSSYSTPSTTRGPASKRSTASLRARNLAGSIIRTSGRIRQRTWSVTLDQMPDGGLKPTGLIAMDGSNLFIPHGPGQHIRPAPAYGPGSTSASGLVDYANVFVKNLDSDINSYYLADMFSPLGRIISARVMRDENGASRGYGFVSFYTPEEAAHAIATMNGTMVGKQVISVTLHEPRKVRPEKLAERRASISPVAYGRSKVISRRSSSPEFTNASKHGRYRDRSQSSNMSVGPAVTDEIRLLSPSSRKSALKQRISGRVKLYARVNNLPEHFAEAAIQALLNDDLTLVPLLYDSAALQLKIAEVMGTLQSAPEDQPDPRQFRATMDDKRADTCDDGPGAASKSGNDDMVIVDNVPPKNDLAPGSAGNVSDGEGTLNLHTCDQLDEALSEEERADLQTEIERINPIHNDDIIAFMLDEVKISGVKECLEAKDTVGKRYGLTERRVADEEEQEQLAKVDEDQYSANGNAVKVSGGETGHPTDVFGGDPASRKDGQESGDERESSSLSPALSPIPPDPPLLPLDDLTLEKLVSQPASRILVYLRTPRNDDLYLKLGITRPSAKELMNHEEWMGKWRRKGLSEQKADVAAQLAKRLSIGSLKKSQKLKIAMGIVESEADMDALTHLLLYHEVLDEMAKAHKPPSE